MKNVPYLASSVSSSLGRLSVYIHPKPLTKINRHSLKIYNNCLSTKSDVIVID